MLGVILAVATLAAETPAAAGAPAATEMAKRAAMAQAAQPDPNRVICRSAPIPGSRIRTRMCLTADAWRQRQLQDQRDLNDSQKGPQVMPKM
ncbi:MAG: hypothetical protein ACXU8S_15590 [Phenylobacterium sp.]